MTTQSGQSIGRPGKLDGISGSDNSGTEGATSGAGVSQGVPAGQAQTDSRQHDATPPEGKTEDASPEQPANPTHGVGKNGAPSAGDSA